MEYLGVNSKEFTDLVNSGIIKAAYLRMRSTPKYGRAMLDSVEQRVYEMQSQIGEQAA